jgi:hypothetical protein
MSAGHLSALGIQRGATFALGLVARSGTPVLRLDVIAFSAFGVVMMDILFDRMPWACTHRVYLLS